MFGFKRKAEKKLEDELKFWQRTWYETDAQLDTQKAYTDKLEAKYLRLLDKWNKLVRQINDKGGQQFLDGASVVRSGNGQFTDAELRSILQLVHPDKHGGKASAVAITQKINKLRG